MIKKKTIKKINEIAKKVRINILKLSHIAKSSHIGSCLSIVDILVVLYCDILKSRQIKNKSNQLPLSSGYKLFFLFKNKE